MKTAIVILILATSAMAADKWEREKDCAARADAYGAREASKAKSKSRNNYTVRVSVEGHHYSVDRDSCFLKVIEVTVDTRDKHNKSAFSEVQIVDAFAGHVYALIDIYKTRLTPPDHDEFYCVDGLGNTFRPGPWKVGTFPPACEKVREAMVNLMTQ